MLMYWKGRYFELGDSDTLCVCGGGQNDVIFVTNQ